MKLKILIYYYYLNFRHFLIKEKKNTENFIPLLPNPNPLCVFYFPGKINKVFNESGCGRAAESETLHIFKLKSKQNIRLEKHNIKPVVYHTSLYFMQQHPSKERRVVHVYCQQHQFVLRLHYLNIYTYFSIYVTQ